MQAAVAARSAVAAVAQETAPVPVGARQDRGGGWEWLRLMEGRWVVADVDAYEEEDADEGADEDKDMSSSSQSSHASNFEVNPLPSS